MNLNDINESRLNGAGWMTLGQTADYLEALELQRARVRPMVIAVLSGEIPSCQGWIQPPGEQARIERLDCGDLLDVMGITDSPELIGKLFAAAFDREAKAEVFSQAEDVLKEYVDKTAALLASEES